MGPNLVPLCRIALINICCKLINVPFKDVYFISFESHYMLLQPILPKGLR